MDALSALFATAGASPAALPVALAIGVLLLVVLVPALRRLVFGTEPRHALRPLLSPWEREALAALRAAVPADWHVCPQVRVADFLSITGGSDQARSSAHRRIRQRSVDFLVIDAESLPRLVIELDDHSHRQPNRRRRDAENDAAYREAGLPVRHIQPGRRPDWLSMIAAVVTPDSPPGPPAGTES